MGKLIIEGNSVYSVDEECLKKRQLPDSCRVKEVLRRQEKKGKRIQK